MHATLSATPVVTAICGMSPSVRFLGRRVTFGSVSFVSTHDFTSGMVILRRHFPSWKTTGMSFPTGMFSRRNCHLASESAVTSGSPEATVPHRSQVTPLVTGLRSPLGT